MVKISIAVACRVTGKTSRTVVGIPPYAVVLIVRFGVGMASSTSEFCIIRRIGMALRALVPFSFVGTAVNGEISRIVLNKRSGHPAGVSGMTFYTVLRKVGSRVLRVGGRIVICLMTGNAGSRRIGKIAVGMALRAVGNVVTFGERKKIVVDPVRSPVEPGMIVAVHTIGGETGCGMVWIGRCHVIGRMATDAIIADPVKTQGRF